MRVPDFRRFTHWLQSVALLVSGAVIGAAVYMGVHHQNFNLLFAKYQKALSENAEMVQEIETLRKYQSSRTVVSKVNVKLELDSAAAALDEIIQTELESKVREDLQLYMGKPVTGLTTPKDQDMVRSIINKRYLVKNKDYTVQLKTMIIIHAEMNIWITAKEFIRSAN